MAMHIPKAPGVAQMLKDGARVSDNLVSRLPRARDEPSRDSIDARCRKEYTKKGSTRVIAFYGYF